MLTKTGLLGVMCALLCAACGQTAMQSAQSRGKTNNSTTLASEPTATPAASAIPQNSPLKTQKEGTQSESKPQRIQFKRGQNTTVIEDTVITNTENSYLVSARAGQTMSVSIKSIKRARFADTEYDASFRIVNARSGEPLEKKESDQWTNSWRGQLPETGDYIINIVGMTDNTWYKLKVAVK